jgi:acetolactate synthase-1/2/3 large subunit
VLLLDGPALVGRGLELAGRVATATGAGLLHATLPARVRRGSGLPPVRRLPYAPDRARALLGDAIVVLVGALPPTTFFGYEGVPSHLVPPDRVVLGADPDEDVVGFLEEVADRLGATDVERAAAAPPERPEGAIDIGSVGAAVAWSQPEDAVVVNAAVTSGGPWEVASSAAPPHDMLTIVGGALGFGLPAAVGAAVACPGRRVIALVADGSALYVPQALWNLARDGLDVTVVAFVNQRYRIISGELARVREPGSVAERLTDIGGIDFVRLAGAFGVPAERVERADELADLLAGTGREPGPALVEVPV